jgi:hypothetical protein
MIENETHGFVLPPSTTLNALIARGANSDEVQLSGSWDTVPILETLNTPALAADFSAHELQAIRKISPAGERAILSCKYDNDNNSEASGIVLLINPDNAVWVGDPAPDADYKIIQISSTTAGVAGVWTLCSMTYPSDLPASGMMTVYGMRCKSASSYAIRVVQGPRQGVPTQHALQGPMVWFRNPWTIDLANKPSFELLSSTTTAAHQIEAAVYY